MSGKARGPGAFGSMLQSFSSNVIDFHFLVMSVTRATARRPRAVAERYMVAINTIAVVSLNECTDKNYWSPSC